MLVWVLSVLLGAIQGQMFVLLLPTPVSGNNGKQSVADVQFGTGVRQLPDVASGDQSEGGKNGTNQFDPESSHSVFQAPTEETRNLESLQVMFERKAIKKNKQYETARSRKTRSVPSSFGGDNPAVGTAALFPCRDPVVCDPTSKYRSINGTCNNLDNPLWGSALSCFQRLRPANYTDGISSFRLSQSGYPLPNARDISLLLNTDDRKPTSHVSLMHVMFGQFLDHDITLTPFSRNVDGLEIECCPIRPDNHPQCAPIQVKPSDPFYSRFNQTCLNFVRSTLCLTCTTGSRQQTNQITAFIDASQVYGSEDETLSFLRSGSTDGTLTVRKDQISGDLLPTSMDPANDQCSLPDQQRLCFEAGDQRVNQQPALVSLHVIFMRQHNRIARALKSINPSWQGEKIFQETRRIIIAQMQVIVYREFLPHLVGSENMKTFNLTLRRRTHSQFNPQQNPTLYNEFSAAAFRYGHSMISSFFPEIPVKYDSDRGHYLRDLYFKPFDVSSGKMEHHLRGLADGTAQKCDRHMIPDVTNYLYRRQRNGSGMDLAAFNIQRGRDHGIPGYTAYVNLCRDTKRIESFEDLDDLMAVENRKILQKLYKSVHDIDLYAGGLAEKSGRGTIAGPTFACIMAQQFMNLKYGDRFYFEHGSQAGSFTHDQLDELRKTTLAKIICGNTRIEKIQPRAMEYQREKNKKVDCSELPTMDLTTWREGN